MQAVQPRLEQLSSNWYGFPGPSVAYPNFLLGRGKEIVQAMVGLAGDAERS